jgi:predicted CXXCH cytochrome family protein
MRKTVRSLPGSIIWLALLTAVGGGAPAADIAGSKHDLGGEGQEKCLYCHTPHDGAPDVPLLWNRATNPPDSYTMYASETLDMVIAEGPQDNSLLCLSCHDGTIAVDNFGGATGGTNFVTGSANLGLDLSDEHPISLTYDPSRDPGNFAALATVAQAGLRFYGSSRDQLECGTCHNAHDPANGSFLRISNAGSAMCQACHLL